MKKETMKINYEELLELMYLKHHTRQTISKSIGMTAQGFGVALKGGIPLPGKRIIAIAKTLEIPLEQIGKYFFTLEDNRRKAV